VSVPRIGVIGGVGPAATILYYRLILDGAQERVGGRRRPEIVLYSLDHSRVDDYLEGMLLDQLAGYLIGAIGSLEAAGCDAAVIACNSMHLVYEEVAARTKIPMVNIVDAALDATVRRGFRAVGLLATTFVVKSRLYHRALESRGIRPAVPNNDEQDWIMEAILDDLQGPIVPPATVERLLANVVALEEQGAEAVMLACTDLSVAITEANSPLPVIDTARIHVDAVLDRVLTGQRGIGLSSVSQP